MTAAVQSAPELGPVATCEALGVSRASLQRRLNPPPALPEPRQRQAPPRSLTEEERIVILGHLHAERFQDRSPSEVYGTLLDEGVYCCSIRTLYRLLAADGENRERRNQLTHPAYQKPELLATAPNQLWSWDITKLLGPAKWTYFYLYVILDVFSRYVVGWMIADREGKQLAKQFIAETCAKEEIVPGQLNIHADRGSSMTSKPVACMLADLGVTKTHSRPHVSNDNPFSESQFKTLKYRPEFPDRFGSLQDARSFCQEFFSWYNTEHHHSGLGLLTPEVVHTQRAGQVRELRQQTLDLAYAAHPERFVRKPPQPPALPTEVWINPPQKPESSVIRKLRPVLTALPSTQQPRVNANTAPLAVLRAIVGDDDAVNNLVSQRTQMPLKPADLVTLTRGLNAPGATSVNYAPRMLGVVSSFFQVRASGVVNPNPMTGRGGISRSATMLVRRVRRTAPAGSNASAVPWTLTQLDWQKEGGAALFQPQADQEPGTDEQTQPGPQG